MSKHDIVYHTVTSAVCVKVPSAVDGGFCLTNIDSFSSFESRTMKICIISHKQIVTDVLILIQKSHKLTTRIFVVEVIVIIFLHCLDFVLVEL